MAGVHGGGGPSAGEFYSAWQKGLEQGGVKAKDAKIVERALFKQLKPEQRAAVEKAFRNLAGGEELTLDDKQHLGDVLKQRRFSVTETSQAHDVAQLAAKSLRNIMVVQREAPVASKNEAYATAAKAVLRGFYLKNAVVRELFEGKEFKDIQNGDRQGFEVAGVLGDWVEKHVKDKTVKGEALRLISEIDVNADPKSSVELFKANLAKFALDQDITTRKPRDITAEVKSKITEEVKSKLVETKLGGMSWWRDVRDTLVMIVERAFRDVTVKGIGEAASKDGLQKLFSNTPTFKSFSFNVISMAKTALSKLFVGLQRFSGFLAHNKAYVDLPRREIWLETERLGLELEVTDRIKKGTWPPQGAELATFQKRVDAYEAETLTVLALLKVEEGAYKDAFTLLSHLAGGHAKTLQKEARANFTHLAAAQDLRILMGLQEGDVDTLKATLQKGAGAHADVSVADALRTAIKEKTITISEEQMEARQAIETEGFRCIEEALLYGQFAADRGEMRGAQVVGDILCFYSAALWSTPEKADIIHSKVIAYQNRVIELNEKSRGIIARYFGASHYIFQGNWEHRANLTATFMKAEADFLRFQAAVRNKEGPDSISNWTVMGLSSFTTVDDLTGLMRMVRTAQRGALEAEKEGDPTRAEALKEAAQKVVTAIKSKVDVHRKYIDAKALDPTVQLSDAQRKLLARDIKSLAEVATRYGDVAGVDLSPEHSVPAERFIQLVRPRINNGALLAEEFDSLVILAGRGNEEAQGLLREFMENKNGVFNQFLQQVFDSEANLRALEWTSADNPQGDLKNNILFAKWVLDASFKRDIPEATLVDFNFPASVNITTNREEIDLKRLYHRYIYTPAQPIAVVLTPGPTVQRAETSFHIPPVAHRAVISAPPDLEPTQLVPLIQEQLYPLNSATLNQQLEALPAPPLLEVVDNHAEAENQSLLQAAQRLDVGTMVITGYAESGPIELTKEGQPLDLGSFRVLGNAVRADMAAEAQAAATLSPIEAAEMAAGAAAAALEPPAVNTAETIAALGLGDEERRALHEFEVAAKAVIDAAVDPTSSSKPLADCIAEFSPQCDIFQRIKEAKLEEGKEETGFVRNRDLQLLHDPITGANVPTGLAAGHLELAGARNHVAEAMARNVQLGDVRENVATVSRLKVAKLLTLNSLIDARLRATPQEDRERVQSALGKALAVPLFETGSIGGEKGREKVTPEALAEFFVKYRGKVNAYVDRDVQVAVQKKKGEEQALKAPRPAPRRLGKEQIGKFEGLTGGSRPPSPSSPTPPSPPP